MKLPNFMKYLHKNYVMNRKMWPNNRPTMQASKDHAKNAES